jgi:Sulfotransferase domain
MAGNEKNCTAEQTKPNQALKYEDLIQDPTRTLESICKFLNINFEDQMLNFYEQSDRNIGRHHSELIFKPLSSVSINKWEKEFKECELGIYENIAGSCLKSNNYKVCSNISSKHKIAT